MRALEKTYKKQMKENKQLVELLQKDYEIIWKRKKELADIEAEIAKTEGVINEAKTEIDSKSQRMKELEDEEKWLKQIEINVEY